MKQIPLTKGAFAIVDDDDFDELNRWKWRLNDGYAVRWSPRHEGNRHLIFMHRVIARTPAGLEPDHVNRNRIDNRKENLRNATHAQNLWNQGPRKNSITGLKGVKFKRRDNVFHAQVTVGGKSVHLGTFTTAETAQAAYARAASLHHGEFARTT